MEKLFFLKRGIIYKNKQNDESVEDKVRDYRILPANIGLMRMILDKVERDYMDHGILDQAQRLADIRKDTSSDSAAASSKLYFNNYNFNNANSVIVTKDVLREDEQVRYISFHYSRIDVAQKKAWNMYLNEFDNFVYEMSLLFTDIYRDQLMNDPDVSNDVKKHLTVFDTNDIVNSTNVFRTKDVTKAHMRSSLKIFLLHIYAEVLNSVIDDVTVKTGEKTVLDKTVLGGINPMIAMRLIYNHFRGAQNDTIRLIKQIKTNTFWDNCKSGGNDALMLFKHKPSGTLSVRIDGLYVTVDVIENGNLTGCLTVGDAASIIKGSSSLIPLYIYAFNRSKSLYVLYSGVVDDDAKKYSMQMTSNGKVRFTVVRNCWESTLRSKVRSLMYDIVQSIHDDDQTITDFDITSFYEYTLDVVKRSDIKVMVDLLAKKDDVFAVFTELVKPDDVKVPHLTNAMFTCLMTTKTDDNVIQMLDAVKLLQMNLPLIIADSMKDKEYK